MKRLLGLVIFFSLVSISLSQSRQTVVVTDPDNPARKAHVTADGKLQVDATVSVGEVVIDTTGLATSVKQSDGSAKTQIVDGSGNVVGSTTNALDVNIKSGSTTGGALETGGNLAAIKAKTDNIPALGQALAGASVPVILPAATITTLTPPAAITGFALETGGNLAGAATSLAALDNGITGNFFQQNLQQVLGSTHSATNPIFVRQVNTTGAAPDDSAIDAAINSGENPVYVGGIFESTPTVIENGDKGALHLDANQNLLVTTPTVVDATGPLFYRLNSAASANLTSVTDGATQLFGITCTSTDATVVYLKLYNKATAPDPSACSANSDCPVFDMACPSAATGSGGTIPLPSQGVYLSTGLGLAIVTGAADTDETAVAATEVKVNLVYKH